MTKITKKSNTYLAPLQAFEKKQQDLVKQNPFIKITNNETFETAKKRRTALLKGRTELQNQQKDINKTVNTLKDSVKTETERLIEITSPAEDLQQIEVKRYENIQETNRIARETEKQEKIDEATRQIDEVVLHFQEQIDFMTFPTIQQTESELQEFFGTDTSAFEDLEMYFSGKIAIVKNSLSAKITDLEKDEDLKVTKQQNDWFSIRNKWNEDFMNVTFETIGQLNTDFDTIIPAINPDDFGTSAVNFIEWSKKMRDLIGNKQIELVGINNQKIIQEGKDKIQKEKDDAIIEKDRIASEKEHQLKSIKVAIESWFENNETRIENMQFKDILVTSQEVEESCNLISTGQYKNDFKDIIELKIDKLETILKSKVSSLVSENKIFVASEKTRIANEKKLAKKNTADEKKRQLKLKPFKTAGIKNINTGNFSKLIEDKNVQDIINEFIDKIGELKNEYMNKINEL